MEEWKKVAAEEGDSTVITEEEIEELTVFTDEDIEDLIVLT